MKTVALFFILVFLWTVPAHGGAMGEIEMRDGTRLFGEILSVESGVFTVKTDALGLVKVEQSKVRAVRYQDGPSVPSVIPREPAPGGAGAMRSEEMKGLRDAMMGDSEILEMIAELRDDPDFQAVLDDPAVMNAVTSGNLSVLLSNPKFMRLLEKEGVQKIERRVNPGP